MALTDLVMALINVAVARGCTRIHRRIIFAFYIHIKTYIWSVVLTRFLPFFTHTLSALRQTRDTNNN